MITEAKTFKDMTEAELIEVKNNYEANANSGHVAQIDY